MKRPVIGWEYTTPVPDHKFNEFLSSRDGRLYYENLDLAQLFVGGGPECDVAQVFPSPLEMVYLPKIPQKVTSLCRMFAEVSAEVGYTGDFQYAYASKANAAEEVVRTALQAGTHYEMSSWVDVRIAELMIENGVIPEDRLIVANGFKPVGTQYAESLIRLRTQHKNVIPVLEDLTELEPLIESGLHFDVGLRQKGYSHDFSKAGTDAVNSRMGMHATDLWEAARIIAATPNLHLKLYHMMIGTQITDPRAFVEGLHPSIEMYARLRQKYPDLNIFDFGGGVPVAATLDFAFDYRHFIRLLLTTLQGICAEYGVPVPHVMGEVGRYTTAEHGAHFFKVILVKENGSAYPWYIIDGSMMTAFPDIEGLAEHFVVLPLTNLDKPFRRVQLGGLTCDSDDIYPPKASVSPLFLPEDTEELYIGFFCIGAYQEMLGGVRGTKHCAIPEAAELLVDMDTQGRYDFSVIPAQTENDVLMNLGYHVPHNEQPVSVTKIKLDDD